MSKKSKNAKLAERVSKINAEKKAAKVTHKLQKGKLVVGVGQGREVGNGSTVYSGPLSVPAAGADVGLVKVKSQMSGLEAAAKVLGEAGAPLNCPAIVAAIFAAGYWQSNGKTPAATLHTAIITEIKKKAQDSRFVKTGRGLFTVQK